VLRILLRLFRISAKAKHALAQVDTGGACPIYTDAMMCPPVGCEMAPRTHPIETIFAKAIRTAAAMGGWRLDFADGIMALVGVRCFAT
jgi:hypothetical protein